jgi:hypothetical protein
MYEHLQSPDIDRLRKLGLPSAGVFITTPSSLYSLRKMLLFREVNLILQPEPLSLVRDRDCGVLRGKKQKESGYWTIVGKIPRSLMWGTARSRNISDPMRLLQLQLCRGCTGSYPADAETRRTCCFTALLDLR